MATPYWTDIDWRGVVIAITGLVAASSPLWMRTIQRKDDAQKRQLDALVNVQMREDTRLQFAYQEAVKSRDRAEAEAHNEALNADFYRNEAYRLEETARDLRHALVNCQETLRLLFQRFQRLYAGDMLLGEGDRIIANYVSQPDPAQITPVARRQATKEPNT